MPWFLRTPLAGGATLVEVAWARTLVALSDGRPTAYFSTDVGEADFSAMLDRASRHEGYKGEQRDLRETVYGDVTVSSQCPNVVTCERRVLCEIREIPGTPLIVRTYRRERLPFSAIPCDVRPDRTGRVRRLELRAHARSKLAFDSAASSASLGSILLAVRLEIDVGGKRDASEWEDLRRTTENTVQNVFLGMTPRRPPRTLAKGNNSKHN